MPWFSPTIPLRSYDEVMKIDLKAVGTRVVVHPCGKPAGPDQRFAIEALTLGDRAQLLWRVA